ncbi:MAG: N-acetylmuramoyl-L-alanine amidase, partial [Acidiferrobacterales bacterium]
MSGIGGSCTCSSPDSHQPGCLFWSGGTPDVSAYNPRAIDIDHSLRLRDEQFYLEAQSKSLIVLHHTVGGSAASTVRWWNADARRIATSYIVERDGTIFKTFPPQCWAWHLGVKDRGLEKRSIGIELASEGGLELREDALYAFGTRRLGLARGLAEIGRVVQVKDGWRGFQWFDAYEPAQQTATIELVCWLCEKFDILPRVPDLADLYAPADLRRWYGWEGVIHHAM